MFHTSEWNEIIIKISLELDGFEFFEWKFGDFYKIVEMMNALHSVVLCFQGWNK